MTLDEAIMSALDGEALLFLGAGFSKGAMNMAQREFPLGKTLCIRLIEDGKIDTSEDSEEDCADLGYITERYLENNTKQDLIKFLRSEFHCNTLADYHKIIAEINWKRIYTTNYDDVFERASGECSILRQSVSPEMSLMEIAERKNAIIHMNGSISELTEETLDSTFKLSSSSYFKRTITDNDWAICLHNDLMNAKCLIFIGYSMDYDLELTQIFASIEKIGQHYKNAMKNAGTILKTLLKDGMPCLEDTDERNQWLYVQEKTFSNVHEAIAFLEALKE